MYIDPISLAYPEIKGCWRACIKNFIITSTFIDHAHQFNAVTPISRCVLLRIELASVGLRIHDLQDVLVSRLNQLAIIKFDLVFLSQMIV